MSHHPIFFFFFGSGRTAACYYSAHQEMFGCQAAQSQRGIITQTESMHLVVTQLDVPSSWDTVLKSHLQRNKNKPE